MNLRKNRNRGDYAKKEAQQEISPPCLFEKHGHLPEDRLCSLVSSDTLIVR